MNNNTKHLYIHIPFCENICTYCDFTRVKCPRNSQNIPKYIDKVIEKLHEECTRNQFETIYIGGGTPNLLSDYELERLLIELSLYLDTSRKYEFTIECNPEFVSLNQAKIFKKSKVNRVSLGVQSTNNKILKLLNRHHTIEQAAEAIKIIQSQGIDNISCDFIYGLENMVEDDIVSAIEFIIENNIKHVSYYALEVKPGSQLAKEGYIVDEEVEADNLEYITEILKLNGFERYEVSNWAIDKEYESMHNKAYWLTQDWKAIGYGASGFEDRISYEWTGSILNWERQGHRLSLADYYLQILMMGLRLIDGIDVVNNKRNSEAYATYFDDIVHCYIRNGHLRVKNINLLHETLVNIVDETKEKQLENIKDKIYDEIE